MPEEHIAKLERSSFNDAAATKLWEEYLSKYIPEHKRNPLTEIWEQSGSPYRKEYAMSHPDELFRAHFTGGARGAPDTLHVGDYGGIHDTITEMTHAYQMTHPELEDSDLYGETPLDLMADSPSLDYAYRRRLGWKSSTEVGHEIGRAHV